MGNLKSESQAYEPKKTLNIADLDKVDITWQIEDRSGTTTKKNREGVDYEETYYYKVMIVNSIEYRVPNVVLEEIKKMLKLKPTISFINVDRTGSGVNTKYEVEEWTEEEIPTEKVA